MDSDRLVDQMRSGGVEVRWFRPFSLWQWKRSIRRTHRKVLVCDGEVFLHIADARVVAEFDGHLFRFDRCGRGKLVAAPL